MNPEDIKDEATLKAWFEGQTREVAATVAYRAVMRVAPAFWAGTLPAMRDNDYPWLDGFPLCGWLIAGTPHLFKSNGNRLGLLANKMQKQFGHESGYAGNRATLFFVNYMVHSWYFAETKEGEKIPFHSVHEFEIYKDDPSISLRSAISDARKLSDRVFWKW